jgi:hypothetical protein
VPLHNRFAHELQRLYLIADDFGGPAKGKAMDWAAMSGRISWFRD